MERTYMFTDAMIPGMQGVSRWDKESRCIKDIFIRNSFATENKVSEMNLSITHITTLDILDQEHQVAIFNQDEPLTLENISATNSFKTGIIKSLKANQYKSLRFYLSPKEHFYLNHKGRKNRLPDIEFIDFEIINGLMVNKGEFPSLLIHFDFVPKDVPVRAEKKISAFAKYFNLGNGIGRKLEQSYY